MLIDSLKNIVGPKGWADTAATLAPHLREWRGAVQGKTPIMLLPATTNEVAEILQLCAQARVAIVPQGGNTGMCAGAVPDESGSQVLLNLARLNRIRNVDAADFSMIVEAGCILANVKAAASEAGRYFPLSLGAEGSCQIGGNVSTNAGGINVLRYGTARHFVLGLEVVLANGTIWNGLKTLRKDTAGYDLKQLFIGSEGTLGIITAAALRLFPHPGPTTTALLALKHVRDAIALLGMFQNALPDRVQAFELIGELPLAYVAQYIPGAKLPFGQRYPWYVLTELAHAEHNAVEKLLAQCHEKMLIATAIVAKNEREAASLWDLRHAISEAEKHAGVGLKHDISVPISRLEEFLESAEAALAKTIPAARVVAFGHLGDGNLHYNVLLPPSTSAAQDHQRHLATTIVYDLVAEFGGSFSAEHGVGRLKKEYLTHYKDAIELTLMRELKSTLDPHGILNPGKVL